MKIKSNQSSGRISRRDFLYRSSAGAMAVPLIPMSSIIHPDAKTSNITGTVNQVWKNKQPGMIYRQLGRTGFMISEVVYGGTRVNSDNIRAIEVAIEHGLNYLDTAPAYGRGASEIAFGKVIARPSMRDKVFLTTKISSFPSFRNNLYKEIFDGLPAAKQEALTKKALEMRKERGVERPEYFVTYFNNQSNQFDGTYLSNAMMEEYGEKVEGSPEFEKMITESLEESLKRLGTDHVDILMCPHATSAPEEVNNPYIIRTFEKLKKQGKVSFLGLSTHNDVAAVLKASIDAGYMDVIMFAYNIVNHGYLDDLVKEAYGKGMGLIGMKAANPVNSRTEESKPPAWRIEKLNHFVRGDMKPQLKAYLWVLQNPYLSAVISDMTTEDMVLENLAIAGQKIEINTA
jgi:aryl-alcohol dehydrogenase-like predicted oxidoreductase